MSYEEPEWQEPTKADEIEMSAQAESTVLLKIMGHDASRIEGIVAELVTSRVLKDANAEHRIQQLVEKAVNDVVGEKFKERICAEVESVLAEGWYKTDSYGTRQNTKLTLKDRIGELLNSVTDNYQGRKKWIDAAIEGNVSHHMTKEFAAEMDAAKQSFRAKVDALLTTKIIEGMREAFGLAR